MCGFKNCWLVRKLKSGGHRPIGFSLSMSYVFISSMYDVQVLAKVMCVMGCLYAALCAVFSLCYLLSVLCVDISECYVWCSL